MRYFVLVAFLLWGAHAASAVEYVFPADAGIIDVKRDFGAKGDGKTDDTAAIQKAIVTALLGNYRNPKFIYLPVGTYVISAELKARITDVPDGKGGWSDGWRCGLALVGQSREKTVIRLKDQTPAFGDKSKPRAMLITGSTLNNNEQRQGGWGNEGFQNTLMNFTVDTGTGNPGATGIDYLASNRGTLEDVTVRSGDPSHCGFVGVDLNRPWPGPALVKNVAIDGFDHALRQNSMDCSMTYEHLTLTNQQVSVIRGTGEPFMSLRGIISRNAVPVMQVDGPNAVVNILDSTFTWTGKGAAPPAITSECHLILKHIQVDGYPVVVAGPGKQQAAAPAVDLAAKAGKGEVAFFSSRAPFRLVPGPEGVPDLPVKETPLWHSSDLTKWANATKFAKGSRTAGIQEAIDSGAEVVYLPNGDYWVTEPIILRGKVRKLMGCEAVINAGQGVDPIVRFAGVEAKTVFLEHLGIRGDVEHDCAQTLVIRKCDTGYRNTPRGTGDVFLEDGMFDHPRILFPQNMWARQLNSEFGNRPNFTNRGGKAWILGYKVEGWVSAILNIGGVTECYALYAMTGNGDWDQLKKTPFVENKEGWVVVSFRDGGQGQHPIKICDTWDSATKQNETWQREFCLAIAGQKFDATTSTPPAPGGVEAKAVDSRSVELRWGAAAAAPLGFSYYLIRRNGQPLAESDKPIYTDRELTEKTVYSYEICTVDQRGGISAPVKATITTPADSVSPNLAVAGIWPADLSCITIDFDEMLDAKSASMAANYVLNPPVTINKATLSRSGTRVILEAAKPLTDSQTYALTCKGLKDRSTAGNALNKSTTEFTAWEQGSGLRLEFWNAKDSFAGKPVATTTEPRIDHWYGDGSPLPGVTPGAFCARWSGIVRPRIGGEYVFNTGAISGCRVIIDGKMVHDQWGGGNEWTWSGPVTFEAGKRYTIVFETHAVSGQGAARLKWKGPGFKDAEFMDNHVLFLPAHP